MIKVKDIEYVVYDVPDLEVMKEFLIDFGLRLTLEKDDVIYMRGIGGAAYEYIARKADKSAFVAFGLRTESYSDLESLVASGLASKIEEIDAPGGGHMAVVTGPDGWRFEIVYGIEHFAAEQIRDPLTYNAATIKNRVNKSQRPPKGSVDVLRLGHCAMTVSNAVEAAEWLSSNLGFVPSEYMVAEDDEDKILGIFMHCDTGDEYVDHHTFLVSQSDDIKIHHCGFEVLDIDANMSGHDYLVNKGYELEVGIGRHMAGSQVFDYWIDPFGMRIEHYSDGDVVNDKYIAKKIVGTPEGVTQWGPIPPPKFFE